MAKQQDEIEEQINVRDKLVDNLLDLSLMNISKIPVPDIKSLRRATILDLSSNRITIIESNFTDLTQLTQIDLSKNRITSICDDFGLLTNLRRLDLYKNQLTRLPLTFGRLKNLKYLDLKENPLNPVLKKLVGECCDTTDCLAAAGRAVDLMKQVERRVVEDREKERQAREDAERLEMERMEKDLTTDVPPEVKAIDDLKTEKPKRRRKQATQGEGSGDDHGTARTGKASYDSGKGGEPSRFRLSSSLWILILLLLAATYVLFVKYYDTIQSSRDEDVFSGSRETILEEYIK